MKKQLEFGDYISVEQKRYVGGNEFYTHKVIRTLESNSYTEVPVDAHKPVNPIQNEIAEIVECICCGVDESKTIRFRVKDVKFSHNNFLSERDKFAIGYEQWVRIHYTWEERIKIKDPILLDLYKQSLTDKAQEK